MINTIFTSLQNVINTFFSWLSSINEKVPILDIALGFFLVYSLSRFFIYPMFKGGLNLGSDSAKDMEKWAQDRLDRANYYDIYTRHGADAANDMWKNRRK